MALEPVERRHQRNRAHRFRLIRAGATANFFHHAKTMVTSSASRTHRHCKRKHRAHAVKRRRSGANYECE